MAYSTQNLRRISGLAFLDPGLFIVLVSYLDYSPKIYNMEKRVLGIVLSLLGIAGLIIGAVQFLNGGASNRNVKEIIIYSLLGAIFFFAGVGLVRNTKDKPT